MRKNRGHTISFALTDSNCLLKLRSHAEVMKSAEAAIVKGVIEVGVKRPLILCLCDKFHVVDGFVLEYMHCMCLGVSRSLCNLWLSAANSSYKFYLGNQVNVIN